MKIKGLIEKLSANFPEYIQESYDNTGSQILFDDSTISKIYICLDADSLTVKDAAARGCNLIISHHPLIFRPVKSIASSESRSGIIIDLIKNGTSLYSIHTNFDKLMYGKLSDYLGYPDSVPLIKTGDVDNRTAGYGSFVVLSDEKIFKEIILETKNRLGLDFVIYSGAEDKRVSSIAFINGSGGGSIEKVISSHRPDCIITGDVNYHNAKYAIDSGTGVIDAGHFGTEFIFKKLLAESVREILSDENIQIIISDVEKNPFKVC